MPEKPAIQDVDGVTIEVGARVVQLAVSDPSKGALASNAKCKGTVVRLLRTKVEVQFDGRTKFRHKVGTDEDATDKINPEYLLVIENEQMPENITIFRAGKP
jgi:hypothetical protein